MTTIIGIDPGANGGLSVYGEYGLIRTFSFSNKSYAEIANGLYCALSAYDILKVFIEKVHAAPGQGVVSMFTFGMNYGFLIGVLEYSHTPYEEVPPQKWQSALGIPKRNGKTYNEHKKVLKAIAQKMYPNIKVTGATADAILIGHYGMSVSQKPLDI